MGRFVCTWDKHLRLRHCRRRAAQVVLFGENCPDLFSKIMVQVIEEVGKVREVVFYYFGEGLF